MKYRRTQRERERHAPAGPLPGSWSSWVVLLGLAPWCAICEISGRSGPGAVGVVLVLTLANLCQEEEEVLSSWKLATPGGGLGWHFGTEK